MNADIADLLERCIADGVRLAAGGGELRIYFDGAPPAADLLALLKQHKPELLRHLAGGARDGAAAAIARLPDSVRRRVAASPAQQRMWLLERIEKTAAPYNMVGAFRLHGRLDEVALEAALDALVARHEALRTNYIEADGELLQVVRDPAPIVWDRIDVSEHAADEQHRQLQALLARENDWRFDLQSALPLRATRMRMSAELVVFVLNVHHIACDGWSIEILKRELAAFYAERVSGQAHGQVPPRIQYVDYCEWQRTPARQRDLARQLDYWRRKLDGLPQLHGLPLDMPRPTAQTYRGAQLSWTLPADVLGTIKAQCRAHGATLAMFAHMALSALLSLYSRERDIVIGFPVAGRRHRDADASVGLFVNTLVLRATVDGDASFAELLAASKQTVLEALAHQDAPYERLIEELKPGRSRAHSPLVQILLAVQNQIEGNLTLKGLVVEPVANAGEPVKFDLQVIVEEAPTGCLEIRWHYNADLFAPESIARMGDSLVTLIELASRRPDLRLYALPGYVAHAAPDAGTRAMIAPLRLEQLFEQHACRCPDQVAVAFESAELTYRELEARASALAEQLRALGAGRDACVALYVERSLEMVVGILAVLKAGAAYVPLDTTYPLQRLAAMVADCDARVVLSQRRFEAHVGAFGKPAIWLDAPSDDVRAAPVSLSHDDAGKSAADPAYVIYTSGTTGMPKGVVVSHASVARLLQHFDEQAPLDPTPNGSLWSSIGFDVSVYEIFAPLCGGGSLHIVPDALRLDPERLFRWMDARAIASTFLYAGYLEPFGEYLARAGGCRALRRMLVGVEPIASDHLGAIVRQLPDLQIINGYGPTEATVCCTTFRFVAAPHAGNRRVPIGRAVAGTELFVMNAGGAPAPLGAIGELHVGGAGLALGYLNRPELTRERFAEHWIGSVAHRLYRTGDLVRYLPSGDLEFVGRVDEQIKIRGFRIEPGEIEVRLCEQGEISDAAVVAHGEGAARRIVAYVVPKPDRGADGAATFVARIRHDLKKFLPDYMLPSAIVLLDKIPQTANGKVNRAALPAPTDALGDSTAIVAPRNAIEQGLLEIWRDVLALDRISTTADFFALGGHSLHVTRVIGRVRRRFGVEESDLSLEDVFENPTVQTLAEVIEAALWRGEARAKESYLASFGQNVEEGVF